MDKHETDKTTSDLAVDSASAGSAWREVNKAAFDKYVQSFPLPLDRNVTMMCEPPMLSYNDFSGGKKWPESMVAKAKLYDGSEYHGGRQPVYFVQNTEVCDDSSHD